MSNFLQTMLRNLKKKKKKKKGDQREERKGGGGGRRFHTKSFLALKKIASMSPWLSGLSVF